MARTALAAWIAAATLAGGSAPAETFYDKDGIRFEGTIRLAVSNAAVCNVLEANEVNYEELKANQGWPLHLWRVDFAVRNWFTKEAGAAAGEPERAVAAAVRYLQAGGREAEPRAGETRVFDGMEFVWIPAGEFLMGSRSEHADDDEQPLTRVRIGRGFWLGRHEVTQAAWQAVMGSNPSRFSGCGTCPVESVSWHDAQGFIGRLNGRAGGAVYRLPTEMEWEYAARAGTRGDTYAASLDAIAWYRNNSGERTHPVGGKAPNAWGLHDMLGNVWEWVEDRYGAYPGGTVTDPRGPGSGSARVARGGGWRYGAGDCRAPARAYNSPGIRFGALGFRLLRTE